MIFVWLIDKDIYLQAHGERVEGEGANAQGPAIFKGPAGLQSIYDDQSYADERTAVLKEGGL